MGVGAAAEADTPTEIPDGQKAPRGNYLTAEQLDDASLEMLQTYSDFGLRTFIEECRHWQAMGEIELERRKSEGQNI
jgi:hypothetical protein